MPHTNPPPSSTPLFANFAAEALVVGAGVAIFHVATGRVVLCSAPASRGGRYFFLPKGRRDAGEEGRAGAEREGYEESGYRNRLLPLPTPHRQPHPHPYPHATTTTTTAPLTAEPLWMQLMPLGHHGAQYVLYWYAAETLPPALEDALETAPGAPYVAPPGYPAGLTLRERVGMEPEGYEPRHHEGTGVDEEEALYESQLVSVEEAVRKLGRGGVMADVVVRAWRGIQERFAIEEGAAAAASAEAVVH